MSQLAVGDIVIVSTALMPDREYPVTRIDRHTATLAEVYRVAQHHVKDNYGFETETLDKKWGEALYKVISKQPAENFIQLTGHELKNSIDICIPDGTNDQLNEEYRFFFQNGKKYVTDLGCDEPNQLS